MLALLALYVDQLTFFTLPGNSTNCPQNFFHFISAKHLLVLQVDRLTGLILPTVDLHHLEADADDVDDGDDNGEDAENEAETWTLGLPGLKGRRRADQVDRAGRLDALLGALVRLGQADRRQR